MRTGPESLERILEEGHDRGARTGTGTRAVLGHRMRFDLAAGFPLPTTKRPHLKSIVHELPWLPSGAVYRESCDRP